MAENKRSKVNEASVLERTVHYYRVQRSRPDYVICPRATYSTAARATVCVSCCAVAHAIAAPGSLSWAVHVADSGGSRHVAPVVRGSERPGGVFVACAARRQHCALARSR